MSDKIEFKIADPAELGETWAEENDRNLKAVEIYINGREFVDILKECEKPFADSEGHPNLAGSYGHNVPKILYCALSEAVKEGTYSNKYGAELLCCRDCGIPGCWSVLAMISEDDDFVYWKSFSHNHRKMWKYDLSFRFVKADYEKEMEKLKSYAEENGNSIF